jgi:hypothetical protein
VQTAKDGKNSGPKIDMALKQGIPGSLGATGCRKSMKMKKK